MGQTRELVASKEDEGKRVDAFVSSALGLSRVRVKALFERGAVRIDGRRTRKGVLLHAGQRVQVETEEAKPALVPEPEAPLTVLHQDESLVFVDKPAGRPSHPLEAGETGTVANALVARFPECGSASKDPREGGLCHRLDVETSGVLLAARTPEAWERVREAFSQRKVDKRYWALVLGPIADDGEIDLPLRHHPKRHDRVIPDLNDPEARPALTFFKVLRRSGDASLVEARIVTGVLHQVRAHLSAIGAPIVQDALYGGPEEPGLRRFFLHARSLELEHPTTHRKLRVESPLPPELASALERRGITPP